MNLSEQFESAERLRKWSEDLKAEQQALATYRKDVMEETTRLIHLKDEYLKSIKAFHEVLAAFTKQIDNFKGFKQLVESTNKMVEAMQQ